MKEIDIQVQEAQRIPNKIDPETPTPKHVIMKMPMVKYEETIFFFFFGRDNLKSSKRKEVSHLKGSFHKTVS